MSQDEQFDAEPLEKPVRERAQETRYSLVEMMEEVRTERKESVLGRELLDSTEIENMFAKRIRKIKR